MQTRQYDTDAFERLLRAAVALTLCDFVAAHQPTVCEKYVRVWMRRMEGSKRINRVTIAGFLERQRRELSETLASDGFGEVACAVEMDGYTSRAVAGDIHLDGLVDAFKLSLHHAGRRRRKSKETN